VQARLEEPNLPSTSVTFRSAGFASLRAVIEVEGEPRPLVAESRLRVLTEALSTGGAGRGRAARALLGALGAILLAGVVPVAAAVGAGLLVLGGSFLGTPGDYAVAVAAGLAVDLAVDRLRGLAGA